MKNHQKGSTTLLIVIGVLLVIAAVAYFIIQKGQTIPTVPATGNQTATTSTTADNGGSTASGTGMGAMDGWDTYANTQFGFTFMYPANFAVNAVTPPADNAQFEWEIRPTKSLDAIHVSVFSNSAALKQNIEGAGCTSAATTFGSSQSATVYTCGSGTATKKEYYVALTNDNALVVSVIADSGQAGQGLTNIPTDTVNEIFSSFTVNQ